MYFIMRRNLTKFREKKLPSVRSFPLFCLFSQQLRRTPQNSPPMAVNSVDNLYFSCALFHLRNTA